MRHAELGTWILGIWNFPGEALPDSAAEGAAVIQAEVGDETDEPEQLPEVPTG